MASRRQAAPSSPPVPDVASARALVDAAKALLAERPPSAISGRALAERAEVNYGLVHRHFGSKSEVLGRALDELLADFAATEFDADGLPVPLRLAARDDVWRPLVHVVLDRAGFEEYRHSTPVLRRCVEGIRTARPRLTDDQLHAVAALAMVLEIGVPLHRAVLTRASGLRDDEPAIDHLARQWIGGLYHGTGPLGAAPSVQEVANAHRVDTVASLDDREPSRAHAAGTVAERLVEAGAELLADRSPSAISGRRLAGRAGINYGLIHHYFGSKDEVLHQSVQLHRDRFFAERASVDWSPRFFSVGDHPGYVRAMTWSALDPDLARAEQRFPVTDQLVQRLVGNAGAPTVAFAIRVAVFVSLAAQMTWALFLPVVEQAFGADPRRFEPALAPLLRDLVIDPMRDTLAPA